MAKAVAAKAPTGAPPANATGATKQPAAKPATPPKPGSTTKKPATGAPAQAAKGAKSFSIADAAAAALRKSDVNGDGAVTATTESNDLIKQLGALPNGTSAVIDQRGTLAVADGKGNGDGVVTADEMEAVARHYDANGDGKFSGHELQAFKMWRHTQTRRYAVTADQQVVETTRGFFKHEGEWFFRNEWGSVARAKQVPNAPIVVDAPAGFDPTGLPGVSQKVGGGNGASPAATSTVGGARGGPVRALAASNGAAKGATAIFNSPGIFVDQVQNFTDEQAQAARAAGFTWVAFQGAHADDQGTPQARTDIDPAWVARMKDLGFRVGIWNVLGSQPEADARMAAAQMQQLDLDLFIADAEASHKEDTGGDRDRSLAFTRTFRQYAPNAPLALSSYAASNFLLGSVDQRDAGPMDYKAWADAGAVFMPQVYPKDFGAVYSLDNTISHAKRAGWEMSQVKPTLGFYRGETPEFYANLRTAGTQGFSVYLGENVTDSSFWSRMVGQE